MKKINVLKNGEANAQEVKMTEKQIREYVEKVYQCLNDMSGKWEVKTCNDHHNPTFEGIYGALSHTWHVLEFSDKIPMNFAFTKPQQCAIYMAFCFGAFDCLDMAELTETSAEAVAMLKVLTSRKARTEILSNC